MNKMTIRDITDNAIIAGLYAVLTIFLGNFGYLEIQFRIAEILLLLCFFRKNYVFGLIIGCLIANFFSPLGWVDVVFGTLATGISALLIAYSRRLFVAWIYPVVINAIVVGSELYFVLGLPFWLNAAYVGIGELAVMLIGFGAFIIIRSRPALLKLIRANQNLPELAPIER